MPQGPTPFSILPVPRVAAARRAAAPSCSAITRAPSASSHAPITTPELSFHAVDAPPRAWPPRIARARRRDPASVAPAHAGVRDTTAETRRCTRSTAAAMSGGEVHVAQVVARVAERKLHDNRACRQRADGLIDRRRRLRRRQVRRAASRALGWNRPVERQEVRLCPNDEDDGQRDHGDPRNPRPAALEQRHAERRPSSPRNKRKSDAKRAGTRRPS